MSDQARHLIRDHAHAAGLQLADALIAATAIVRDLELFSGNRKHLESVTGLAFVAFRQ